MAIYRLDLDALEATENEYQASAVKVSEKIEDLYSVISEVNEDIYSGEDAKSFRLRLADYIDRDVKLLQEKLSQIKTVLADGLDDARGCKKICNDFIISLGGESIGKSEADIRGEFYCDQSVIDNLKGFCRLALIYSDSIRKVCANIEEILSELQMVKLDPTPYTCVIKEGCDKVDRLEDHSIELGSYASKAEIINESFRAALDGCIPESFLEDEYSRGIGILDVLEETIMRIMGIKGELSNRDKAILDEQLRLMEEKGDIEGIQKVAEHAGNGENEAWTAGDVYVMAHIYNYAENNAKAELATVVYDKMKVVKCDKTTNSGYPPCTIFSYEFKLDENKVAGILAELDPEKDGLAYYSLQRRSKYYETKIVIENERNAEDPKLDLMIQFTHDESGRLVSIFTVDGGETRLASVDMNEVVGQEWDKSPMNGMRFSEEERIALMSSIYTDEDIPFIRDLVRAKTEEDYREVFQHDPNLLSVNTKAGLYNYSVALVDKNVKYDENMMITKQNFTQLESFINGMLYKESDRIKFENYEIGGTNDWAGDYRKEYLESMIMCGETQMDILRYQMEANYKDADYVKNSLGWFAENTQILSLYATIDTRMSKCSVYLFQDNYMKIDDLDLDLTPVAKVAGENMNEIMFSYHENIMNDDEAVVKEENGEAYTADIIITKLTGGAVAEEEFCKECVRKIKQARYALPKGIIKACTAMIPDYIQYAGEIADKALGYADLVDNGVSVYEVYREAEEANEKLNQMLSGAQIVYTAMIGDSEVDSDIVLGGKYDANSLLKMEKLENEGLRSFHSDSVGLANETIENITGKNIANNRDSSEKYLLWVGEQYLKEQEKKSKVNSIEEIDADEIREKVKNIENLISPDQRFNYLNYNILEEYYFGDEKDE